MVRINFCVRNKKMKLYSSLKSKKARVRGCKLVRRRGLLYVINKKEPKYKCRQG